MSEIYRKEKLPKAPFSNIAVSLSGGGYRATAFHLGAMSYLSTKSFQGQTLLERTRILSTVSAGSFIGVKYATILKKGGTIKDCYQFLYRFMTECDLVSKALQLLSDDKYWVNGKKRTLINAFSEVYFREFESEVFDILNDKTNSIHLKEIIFNATEFHFGLPFRFQKSERLKKRSGNYSNVINGNKKIPIPEDVVKEIRLAHIMAASSCFPFGFEPINFPDDFIYEEALNLKDIAQLPEHVYDGEKIQYPIGLMDGSIDDNQGVDAVIYAEQRLKHYPPELQYCYSKDEKSVDLYILSDASTPKITSYKKNANERIKIVGKWNFGSLQYFGVTSAIIGISSIAFAFFQDVKFNVIALSIFGTCGCLSAFVLLLFSLGLTGLTRKLGVPEYVVKRLLHFDKLKLGTVYNMIVNRKNSAMTLISDVFIKHMRWFSYERVYGDVKWRPRLIMNAIFEFTEEEVEKRKRKYPDLPSELLEPGEAIILATEKANTMGTKLWFTPQELAGDNNMIDTIIACGQFNLCFNLLEYIYKYIKNEKFQSNYRNYDDETKLAIDQLEQALLADWIKFRKNPYWMVNEWNKA